MTKIAVVTARIGNRNNSLLREQKKYDNVDYHAFIDSNEISNTWITHKTLDFTTDDHFRDRRNAKIYKILPFLFLPDYDYYFWVDSTHDIIFDPNEAIKELNSDMAVCKHPQRICLYDEAGAVKYLKYDHFDLLDLQMRNYYNDKYPYNNGLYELGCFILKNTKQMQELCLMWWENICKYTSRDQLSYPYVIWKKNFVPQIIEGSTKHNKYFTRIDPITPSKKID